MIMLLIAPSFAHGADLLEPFSLSFETGKIEQSDGREDLYLLSVQPTYSAGRISATLGINFYAYRDGKMRDGGNDSLVIESLTYDDEDKFRFHYGELENLTFGSGFIVSNYRSNIRGQVPLNRQKGFEIDLVGPSSYIKAFGTKTNLIGLRAIRNFGLFNVGATAVADSNPDFEEVGIDAEFLLIPDKITLYAEGAKIIDYGAGYAFGAILSPHKYVDAKVEYRGFDEDFVPGIVDEHYELRPAFDRMSYNTGTWGLYTSLDLFKGEFISGTVTYEDYEDIQSRITCSGTANLTSRIRGELFYAEENYLPDQYGLIEQDKLARASMYIKFSKKGEFIIDYYNAFDDKPSGLESFAFKTKFRIF